ncbi:MAG: hypothetical protein ACI4SK_02020, partial [Christensenellales bacterium]
MKTMKKSMFITTIMMVVLLVVALSTATFAWYTAQANVTVTNTLVTAANSTSASLAIDKTASIASTNSSVDLTIVGSSANDTVAPMVPTAAPTATDDGDYAAFVDSFYQQSVDNANKFNGNGVAVTPATIKGVKAGDSAATNETEFYVINTNRDNATADIKATLTIKADGYMPDTTVTTEEAFNDKKATLFTKSGNTFVAVADDASYSDAETYYKANANIAKFLRVAMFVDGKYVATWSGDTIDVATYHGTITNQANATTSLSHYDASANGAQISIGSIAASSAKKVQFVVWYDGVLLGNADAGATAQFTVSFQ